MEGTLAGEGKSILVVDDDLDDVFLIEEAIDEIVDVHHRVTVANDLGSAMQLLIEGQFDIVLSDYSLGASTGIDLINTMRASKIMTPVILLTGMSERAIDEKALKAGASDYLSKTMISAPVLDRAIRYSLANAQRQELLLSVLANVKAAICVIGKSDVPVMWNADFLSLASNAFSCDDDAECVTLFTEHLSSLDRQEVMSAFQHERKTTELPDGRKVIMLHDMSEHVAVLRKREEAELKAAHQAKHCFMTGLPNRLAFTEHLKKLIDQKATFSVLNIDLDNFKTYNDVYGHLFGDSLLEQVSERFRECIGENDFLARVGGDEFIAIQLFDGTPTDGVMLEQKVVAALTEQFTIEGRRLQITASIGVAHFPDHATASEDLLANADIAMYRAKSMAGSNIEYYSSTLDDAVRERRRLTNDLQIAIRDETFDVYFQPQFQLDTGELIGCEALARWNHPQDGFIRPDIFIEIAEDCGLIEDLGKLILRKACHLASQWSSPIKVAVNISGVQVRHTDLVADVRAILLESGFPARRLELEVTETVLIDDFDYALHVLRGIKSLGVGLAMDDFGTGFSSLSSLISFPFDKLKIDRSFIMDMEKREQLKSVVRTCIGLGQNLDLRIVAEGVEQESHIDFLRAEGCDEIQGYFVGKPMPQDMFIEFMRNIENSRETPAVIAKKQAVGA